MGHGKGTVGSLPICTGATGLEPATPGFGDRCATNCATPLGCATIVAVPLAALFTAITLAFAGIAVWTAESHKWVIALAAAALAAWMATLAWAAVRKTRA